MYAQEISASRFVELCLGMILSKTILFHTHIHTHTPYFLRTSLTTFFFTPLAVHTWYFSCVAVTNRD